MASRGEKSYVHVTSTGSPDSTKVYLVIVDSEGHELRYRIPNVRHMKLEANNASGSVLYLEIGNARAGATIPIGMGKKTTAGDLLAEISAAMLADAKETE